MTKETDGQVLQRLGTNGGLWAEEMHKRFPSVSEDDLLPWCCNMIMAGYDNRSVETPVVKDECNCAEHEGTTIECPVCKPKVPRIEEKPTLYEYANVNSEFELNKLTPAGVIDIISRYLEDNDV